MNTAENTENNSSRGVLSVSIQDLSVLYASYMPFLQNGGIFIPTGKNYRINDEVFILLSLPDEPEKIPVNGKIVWVTPQQAQGNKAPGIGVQFLEKNSEAKSKIEQRLTGLLNSDKPTHTI
ncbi:MAG: pilus assembly protein PilZ [Gammaproteobacteria bacterium]|nr:pilus assembly protein PilZ [Gammaproteobacteria bacterium]MAY02500.1 pilus assembly protein PilZ [Gammaproteobacteria bacterium]|tara:strand:- start:70756 stop:71118 length:363 start_codon:yes stop_codon:yes gene_type:complete